MTDVARFCLTRNVHTNTYSRIKSQSLKFKLQNVGIRKKSPRALTVEGFSVFGCRPETRFLFRAADKIQALDRSAALVAAFGMRFQSTYSEYQSEGA